jgi:hypothetical protein
MPLTETPGRPALQRMAKPVPPAIRDVQRENRNRFLAPGEACPAFLVRGSFAAAAGKAVGGADRAIDRLSVSPIFSRI